MGPVLSRAARRRSARLQGRQGASTSDAPPENGASQRVASAFVSEIAERMPEVYTRCEAGCSVPVQRLCLRGIKVMLCAPPGGCLRKHALHVQCM